MPRVPVPTNRWIIFVLLAVVGLAIDLGTKSWIFGRLGMPHQSAPIWIIDGNLSLETSLNEGALFGLGHGFGFGFAALSLVAIGGILYWLFYVGAASDRLLNFALGMITGGILGNLYDRLGLPALTWHRPIMLNEQLLHEVGDPVYAVRDWIHYQNRWFDWPIFNIADSLLVVGVGLLLWHSYAYGESYNSMQTTTVSADKASLNKATANTPNSKSKSGKSEPSEGSQLAAAAQPNTSA